MSPDLRRPPEQQRSAWGANSSVIFCGLALFAILAYGFKTGTYDQPKWAAIHLSALVAVGLGLTQLWRSGVLYVDGISLAAFSLLLFTAISLLWAADPQGGLIVWARILSLAAVFAFTRTIPIEKLTQWLPPLFIVVGLVLLYRAMTMPVGPYGGYGNENFETEVLLCSCPFIAAGWHKRQFALRWISVLVLLGVATRLLFFNASKLEYFVVPTTAALVALGLTLRDWRWRGRVAGGLAVFAAIAAATALSIDLSSTAVSIGVRLELSVNTLLMWLDKPFLGHGLASFSLEYPRFQERHLAYFSAVRSAVPDLKFVAGAAHNEFIQLLAEAGVLGFVIAVSMVALVVRTYIEKLGQFLVLDAAAVSVIFLILIACLEFPLQNPATAFIGAAGLGVMANRAPGAARLHLRLALHVPKQGTVALLVVAFCTYSLIAYGSALHVLAGRDFAYAKYLIERDPAQAYQHNWKAYERFPFERHYRRQLYLTLVAAMKSSPAVKFSTETIDQAYEISRHASPYDPLIALQRAIYLIDSRQYRDKANIVEALISDQKRSASRLPETHLLEAYIAYSNQDWARLRRAIAAGRSIPALEKTQSETLKQFERAIPLAFRAKDED